MERLDIKQNLSDQTNYAPEKLMARIYTAYYLSRKDHGPQASRISLLRRAKNALLSMREGDWAIDVGSGRQGLEREMLKNWGDQFRGRIVTVDIASLSAKQLLAEKSKTVHHLRTNGAQLPLQDNSFSVAISHMGLELMPEEAIRELARILKPEGKVFINVLHRSIVEWRSANLEEAKDKRSKNPKRDDAARQYWDYYGRKGNIFTHSPEEIRALLKENGLEMIYFKPIEHRSTPATAWVEIDLKKNVKGHTIQPGIEYPL